MSVGSPIGSHTPRRSRVRRLLTSPLILTVSRLVSLALPLLTAPVVARLLGASDRGLYGAGAAALALLPVLLGVGLPLAVRHRAAVEPGPDLVSSSLVASLVAMVPAAGYGLVVQRLLLPGLSGAEQIAFVGASVLACAQTYSLCLHSVLIVRQKYARVAAIQTTQVLTMTCVVLLTWATGTLSLAVLFWGLGASFLGTAVVAQAGLRTSPFAARPHPVRLLLRGVRYAGSQIAEIGGNVLIPMLAVVVIGSHEAGYLSIAITIASVPLVVGHTIGIVAFRTTATLDDEQVRRRLVARILRISLLLGGGAAALVGSLCPVVIPVLFGDDFESSVVPAVVASAGAMIMVTNYVASQLMAAMGRGWAMTSGQILGLVISVGVFLALGESSGAVGGAVAILSGRLATLTMALIQLRLNPLLVLPRPQDVGAAADLVIRGRLPQV